MQPDEDPWETEADRTASAEWAPSVRNSWHHLIHQQPRWGQTWADNVHQSQAQNTPEQSLPSTSWQADAQSKAGSSEPAVRLVAEIWDYPSAFHISIFITERLYLLCASAPAQGSTDVILGIHSVSRRTSNSVRVIPHHQHRSCNKMAGNEDLNLELSEVRLPVNVFWYEWSGFEHK